MEEPSIFDDEKIIRSFMTKITSIPSCISKVCKVQKQVTDIKTPNFLEITKKCIFIDGNELVGLVIF